MRIPPGQTEYIYLIEPDLDPYIYFVICYNSDLVLPNSPARLTMPKAAMYVHSNRGLYIFTLC